MAESAQYGDRYVAGAGRPSAFLRGLRPRFGGVAVERGALGDDSKMPNSAIALILVLVGAGFYTLGLMVWVTPSTQPTRNKIANWLILAGVLLFVAAGVVASL